MSKLLTLNKDENEFFVAICKQGFHSFLVFGARDKTTKVNRVLARIGKVCDRDNPDTSVLNAGFNFLFSEANARLESEMVISESNNQALISSESTISYKAYSINIEHYRSFLEMLTKSNRFTDDDSLCAYQVTAEDDASLTFEFERITSSAMDRGVSLKVDVDEHLGTKNVRMGNSCRHTALSLLELGFGSRFYDVDMISNYSNFTRPFPYQTKFSRIFFMENERRKYVANKMGDDLLLFPLPPSPFKSDVNEQSHLILKKIFKQLHAVTSKHLDNDVTYKKFYLIKTLYQTVDALKDKPIEETFDAIDKWALDHAGLIDQKRSFTFFSTTGTRDMVNSFHHMREKLVSAKQNVGAALSK